MYICMVHSIILFYDAITYTGRFMDRQTEGWMYRHADRQIYGLTDRDRQTCKQTDRQTDRQIYRLTDGDRQMYKQRDGQRETDRQTDGRTDGQTTERRTDRQIPYLHKNRFRELFSVHYLDGHLLACDTVNPQLHQPCPGKRGRERQERSE